MMNDFWLKQLDRTLWGGRGSKLANMLAFLTGRPQQPLAAPQSLEHPGAQDEGLVTALLAAAQKARWHASWEVLKFEDQQAWSKGLVQERVVVPQNKLLWEGINELFTLLCGAGTAFSNANAYIGVGDGALDALTGTLTFTNGSAAVSGSGTAFDTETQAGDWIMLDADDVLYLVSSVTNATNLVLSRLYADTGGAGAGSLFESDDTGLKAAVNKTYKAMDVTYPTYGTSQQAVWRSTFGASEANYAWKELTVCNGNSDAGKNLNRLVYVSSVGTKASPGVWTVSLTVSLE